jgi:hypothetical protein
MSVLRSTLIGAQLRAEQLDEPVPCGLVEQQLVSLRVRARLDANAQRSVHRFFESCGGCDLVGVRTCSRRSRLSVGLERGMEVPDGPPPVGGALAQLTSPIVVRFGEERFAMALRKSPALDQLDRLVG